MIQTAALFWLESRLTPLREVPLRLSTGVMRRRREVRGLGRQMIIGASFLK